MWAAKADVIAFDYAVGCSPARNNDREAGTQQRKGGFGARENA